MAYRAGSKFYSADLTTRAGALSAASGGAIACFIACGLAVFGALFLASTADSGTVIAMLFGVAAECLLFLVAGLRLRAGRGGFWGIAAALVILVEIVMKLVSMTGLGGLLINVMLLVVIANGVRGAFALRRRDFSAEDLEQVFD